MQILQQAPVASFAEICQLAPQDASHFQLVLCLHVIRHDTVDMCMASIMHIAAELPRKGRRAESQPGCSVCREFAADEAAPLPIPVVVIGEHSEQISQATMGCSPVPGVPKCCPAQCGCGTAVYGTLEQLMAGGLAVSTWIIISSAPRFSPVKISVDEWEHLL